MSQTRKRFLVEMIKPSHYDDDGYVIQWWRGFIASNSLSALYGIALDACHRHFLGPDVDIVIEARDETNMIIPTRRIIRRFKRNGDAGLVCFVGVQTNQFPRAMAIAREFRASGLKVVIGGFHVSGLLAMLPELPPELREAVELGITLFAGEAENHFGDLLRAAYEDRLKPIYNFMSDLPELAQQPLPFMPRRYVRRYAGAMGCFDAGRGCPFNCSFCTIINVQGRKSRFRTADDIEQLIRKNLAQGTKSLFISDDDFARNRNWEEILDRIIALRSKENLKVHLTIQVDALSHKIPGFVKKAALAGCKKVFIGLENINPDSLKGASKGQNRITEYRAMLQAWHNAKVITYAGYILGFPGDTPESIRRDIKIIQRELPIDLVEFFMLTPLPGSKDHQDLYRQGIAMAADLNNYDVEHAVTAHPRMSAAEWQSIYNEAWHLYYSPEHIKTLLRRAKASGIRSTRLAFTVFYFYASYAFEHVHPLQSGVLRRKNRRQRRETFPRENLAVFFLRRIRDFLGTYPPGLRFLWRIEVLRRAVENEPVSLGDTDVALSPIAEEYGSELGLFNATPAAREVADRASARNESRNREGHHSAAKPPSAALRG
jgi:Radical SAM superfamily